MKPLKNVEKKQVSIKGAVRGYKTLEGIAVLQDEERREMQNYRGLSFVNWGLSGLYER